MSTIEAGGGGAEPGPAGGETGGGGAGPGPAGEAAHNAYVTAQESLPFVGLRRRFRNWVFPVTVAFMAWYLLYVVLSAWARDFMGATITGNINVGLVFGVLQFVTTFGIGWAYQRHMNRHVDPVAELIQTEIEGGAK